MSRNCNFFQQCEAFAGEAVAAWAHEVGEFSFIFYSDSGTHSDPTHINEIHASSECEVALRYPREPDDRRRESKAKL